MPYSRKDREICYYPKKKLKPKNDQTPKKEKQINPKKLC